MPKVRGDGRTMKKRAVIQRKHRVGNRKGGKPAHQMKTSDLQVAAERKDKYAIKAKQVLKLRGVI